MERLSHGILLSDFCGNPVICVCVEHFLSIIVNHFVLYPQVMYYRDARDVYTDLSTKLGSKKGDMSPEDYRQTMKQKLAEIRALSITLDD